MLKGKQKKLDVNKDGKISGDDFAMLKNVRMQKKDAMGKKVVKAESGKMIAKDDTTEYVKRRKKLGGAGTIFKAESGKMVTEAEAPDLGGMMGAQAAPETFDRISEIDTAMAERGDRRPLPMLQEPQQLKKNKPITPKERREKDIAKRAQKKMGGGMMMQDSMGYKKGGAVRGGRKEIKGLRPAKMF
jgi:hypothetical protein